ncbi:GNAT family N-acetyltransferase [Butyrivibrio sp. VCB2006]|uniref:GNAT family N-acetyltransferase n=1 Tax=Butyrivibrio sp. VCB2006 TaxID=1280679 RepID=UPI00041FAC5D|nr:GNAT family N-acetyltransferase [Butyrivibrio sp. VCB2006]
MTGKWIKVIPFDMKYLRDYHENFNEEIARYQWPDPFENEDAAREVLQEFLDEMEKEEMLIFSIVDENEKFVGSVEMHGLTEECPELGVWIVEAEQGKGYAFDALNFILDYAHEKYGKSQFFYEADIRNAGSNKLLEKLSSDYDIEEFEVEDLVTDSGKELKLKGNELRRKTENE